MPVTLSLQDVYELSRAALIACGANEANAASVARSIREAEAEGISLDEALHARMMNYTERAIFR